MEGGDGALCFVSASHFDESKAFGPSLAVFDNVHALNGSVLFKQESNGVFGQSEAEITYKNIGHVSFLLFWVAERQWGRIGAEAGILDDT